MIELHSIVKTYGTHTALHGLDLAVPAGEIFGFIGPNGAGKTTTIKIIGGIMAPTIGHCRDRRHRHGPRPGGGQTMHRIYSRSSLSL